MAAGIDISGLVGSNIKGDEAIKNIMESEEKKKTPTQNEKFRLQMQKQAWSGLQKKLSDLATATRNVMNPIYSAFRKIKTQSSSPDILNISLPPQDASQWQPADYKIIPKQMAQSDHFRSDIIESSQKIPATNFQILSSGKSYNISFAGGSLNDFIGALNQSASDVLLASQTQGEGGNYIDIQGKGMGKKSRVDFSGNIEVLRNLGLIHPSDASMYDIDILSLKGLSGSKEGADFLANGNSLLLSPGDSATKTLDSSQEINTDDAQLWIYLKQNPTKDTPHSSSSSSPQPTSSLSLMKGQRDKIWVGDADLMGEDIYNPKLFESPPPSRSPMPSNSPSIGSNALNSLAFSLGYVDGKSSSQVANWNPRISGIQIVKIPLPKGALSSVTIQNTGKQDASIIKAKVMILNKGKWEPKNSITKAQDAVLNYKGVDYSRDSNTIKDVLPGTLQLNGTSDKPVSLSVRADENAILDQIKQWIIAYNNAMDYIKNVTKEDFSLISQRDRDRNKEISAKRAAYEKLSSDDKKKMGADGSLFEGSLASDSMIGMLKSKLQGLTKKTYSTDLKTKLMVLSQLGIAVPNANQLMNLSDEELENYRAGYLDFTKEGQDKFLQLLKESPKAVQQLLFQRINQSQTYNAGMLYDYQQLLSLYLQRYSGKNAGFFLSKSQLLDTQIRSQDKILSQMDDKMKRDEEKLRNDFAKVYNAQSQAKSIGAQIASRFGNKEG